MHFTLATTQKKQITRDSLHVVSYNIFFKICDPLVSTRLHVINKSLKKYLHTRYPPIVSLQLSILNLPYSFCCSSTAEVTVYCTRQTRVLRHKIILTFYSCSIFLDTVCSLHKHPNKLRSLDTH